MSQLYRSWGRASEPRVGLGVAALHLGALTSFTIAWQYFQPLGEGGELLVKHGVQGFDLVLLAVCLVVVPPALLVAAEALAGLVYGPLRDGLHLLFVGALLWLVCWQFLSEADKQGAIYLRCCLVGAIGAVAYWRLALVRSYLTVLSFGPALVLVLFLLFSPARTLALADRGPGPVRGVTADAPVVVIVLDQLPSTSLMDAAGRIDAVRYPSFAGFADGATWYRNATTVGDYTHHAVPAVLTGKRPASENLPVAADHPDNLFRLLGGRYRVNAMEWFTDLCTPAVCVQQIGRSRAQRLRSVLGDPEVAKIPVAPFGATTWLADALRPSEESVRRASTAPAGEASVRRESYVDEDVRAGIFVDSLRPRDRPTLDFIHLLLPHAEWNRLPGGQRYESIEPSFIEAPGIWPADPRFGAVAQQRHLLQLAHTDRLLGQVIARLEAGGAYDRSLVVVTADHGMSFEGGQPARDATNGNIGEVAPVPLIVKAPGQRRGRISDRFVQSVDVLPTVAFQLGVDIPWRVDGRPAEEGPDRDRLEVHRLFESEPLAVRAAVLRRARGSALRRKVARFGTGTDRGLWAPGGHKQLIGAAVDRLDVEPGPRLEAVLDDPARFRSVDPRGRTLPAEVTGRLRGGQGAAPRRVALAMNGTVVATAWTRADAGEERFIALCPAWGFRRGANRVELFALSGRGRSVRLARLQISR